QMGFPQPGTGPTSPALEGGFLTTGPLGKSPLPTLLLSNFHCLHLPPASLVWHPFPSLSTQFSQLPGPSVSFPQIQFAQTGVKLEPPSRLPSHASSPGNGVRK
ncbi:unnamed protein product, partial [Rangifer tarandus platyrhynchus]